jgi:hypothetical protein
MKSTISTARQQLVAIPLATLKYVEIDVGFEHIPFMPSVDPDETQLFPYMCLAKPDPEFTYKFP